MKSLTLKYQLTSSCKFVPGTKLLKIVLACFIHQTILRRSRGQVFCFIMCSPQNSQVSKQLVFTSYSIMGTVEVQNPAFFRSSQLSFLSKHSVTKMKIKMCGVYVFAFGGKDTPSNRDLLY